MSNLTKEKIEELYSKLLINPDFERLEIMRNQPNIFEILGVSHFEIRHSHFLAWLFNPNGNHGIGDYFLKRFLLDIFQDERTNHSSFSNFKNFHILSIHQLLKENIIIHREKYNIDILIEFESAIIVIENKIHAGEGNDQLQRYHDIIKDNENYKSKKPIFVFLTKYGHEASLKDLYIEISYQDNILKYLNDLIEFQSDSIQDHVLIYLKDYVDNLNKNIMKQDPANILAEKIYRQHQDLFDFIIANKTNPVQIIINVITQELQNKGYSLGSGDNFFLRFLPKSIYEIVPKENKRSGWRNREPFLWELYFNEIENKIEFKIAISAYYPQFRNQLISFFIEADLEMKFNNDWAVFESKDYYFDFSRFDETEYIKSTFNKIMSENESKIDKLSQIILANQTIFN